jgi:hypothetical protein
MDPDTFSGVACAFAPGIAKTAFAALGGFTSNAPQGMSSKDTVEGPKGAYKPAIKARDRKVGENGGKKYGSGQPCGFIMPLGA